MNLLHNNPTLTIKTLGCKVNQYESEIMRQSLLHGGFNESEDFESADFYIINSCTVTHKADRDTRRLIRHFHELNPNAKIIVCGCYAEMKEDRELLSQIPGVSCLLRNREKEKISEILKLVHSPQFAVYSRPWTVDHGQTTNYKLQGS